MNDDYAVPDASRCCRQLDHHSFTGISRAMIANRISYAFGLHGPSMTVDSGQSSSLVAVHLACESLRTGAVAAGDSRWDSPQPGRRNSNARKGIRCGIGVGSHLCVRSTCRRLCTGRRRRTGAAEAVARRSSMAEIASARSFGVARSAMPATAPRPDRAFGCRRSRRDPARARQRGPGQQRCRLHRGARNRHRGR